jgi:dihydrofolate reductase
MGSVVMHNVVSVDGYIADKNDDIGPLFDWLSNGDTEMLEGAVFRISKTSADYVRPDWENTGVMVIGRHLFDMTNGWGGSPPAGEHVVVVSHRPQPDGWEPHATVDGPHPGPAAAYHFIDDVTQAIGMAKKFAGDRTVSVNAGDVGGQAFALGLIDEVAMDAVPVVFGSGKRYFGSVEGHHLLENPHVVIQGDRVLHLRYRVRR